MSKTADKLAKLAGFGMLAGSEPAAAARESLRASETRQEAPEAPRTAPEPQKPAQTPPEPSETPKKAIRAGQGTTKTKADDVSDRDNLTRNVVFMAADQVELDRIEDLLRTAGVRKPTIADLVRVALRAANPAPEEAARLFREAKAFDSRRAENKARPVAK